MIEQLQPKLEEPFAVADTFVSGLAEVEHAGGDCYRFVFYALHHHEGREERLVVAKLVMPMEAVPPALLQTAKTTGFCLATQTYCRSGPAH